MSKMMMWSGQHETYCYWTQICAAAIPQQPVTGSKRHFNVLLFHLFLAHAQSQP